MATKTYVVQEFDSNGAETVWQDLRYANPAELLEVAVKIRDHAQSVYGKTVRIVQRTEEVIEES